MHETTSYQEERNLHFITLHKRLHVVLYFSDVSQIYTKFKSNLFKVQFIQHIRLSQLPSRRSTQCFVYLFYFFEREDLKVNSFISGK